MSDEEREQLKAKLIEAGFWTVEEAGNPSVEMEAARSLRDRINDRLDAILAVTGNVTAAISDLTPRTVSVIRDETPLHLATGDTYSEAICNAALALPSFLEQHPQCAAKKGEQ